jgi:uncharacterized protein (TIGR02996 family)
MTTEDALWRAVEAAPADPVPKAALSDYLEERGQSDTAYALRWMMKYGKMPLRRKPLQAVLLAVPFKAWYWPEWPSDDRLPEFLDYEMNGRRYAVTLSESVAELGGALARIRALVAAD